MELKSPTRWDIKLCDGESTVSGGDKAPDIAKDKSDDALGNVLANTYRDAMSLEAERRRQFSICAVSVSHRLS